MKLTHRFYIVTALLLSVSTMTAFGQALLITSTNPTDGEISVNANSNISITFDQNIQVPGSASFYAVSSVRGLIPGTIAVSGSTLTFDPNESFAAGDLIRIGLTENIVSTGGDVLALPRTFQFMVKAGPSPSDPPVYKDFKIPYSNPAYKENVKALDFDRDGDVDILTEGIWFRNNGNEGFSEQTLSMPYSYEIETADIDHDNDWDLLVGTYYGIAVMINDGAMNFTTDYIADTKIATSLSVADQNGDGLEDILYADQYYNAYSLAWQLNNGDGTFTKLLLNNVDFSYKAYPVDIDGDHLLDVVGIGNNKIYWYKNNGAAHVKNLLYEHSNSGTFYESLIVKDTDNDGDPDILAPANGYIDHLVNDGAGTFENLPLAGAPYTYYNLLDVADIDGDEDLDIIGSNSYSIMCFVNGGSNSYSTRNINDFDESINAASVVDVDGDGDLDLTYASYYGDVGWLKNTSYSEAVPFDMVSLTEEFPASTSSASWADYDADGDQDVLVAGSQGSTYVTRVYRKENESLELAKELPALVNATAIWFDFDNDGDPDILVNGGVGTSDPWNNAQVKIFINSAGDFTEYVLGEPFTGGYLAQVKAADLNNDGKDEIIVSGSYGGVYTFDGSAYKKVFQLPLIFQNGRIATADIDLDGDLDMAATGWLGNDELGALGSVFINHGNFNFEERKKTFNGITSGSLLFSDFDNDSDPELASIGSHRAAWGGNYASSSFYNNTTGNFEFINPGPGMIYVGHNGAAAAADFDNDGYNDLITQHGEGWNQLDLFLNNKASWFNRFDYEMPGVYPDDNFIEAVDFDLDQDVDFIVGEKLIRNNTDIKNNAPTTPAVLVDSVHNNFLYMHWSGASDVETATLGLTYQPFVGTTANGQDVMSALADLETGIRYVQRPGIASGTWKIKIANGGDYYWGVQSIDPGLMSSPFAKTSVRVIHIEGKSASCRNIVQTYKATPAGAYTWLVEGGEIKAMSGDEISIEWTSDTGKVKVFDGLNANTLDVHVVDKPAPAIAGLSLVCASSASGSYSTVNVDGHDYRWEVSGGNFLQSPDSAVAFVRWGTSGSGLLKVFETSREGICTIESQLEITVQPMTTPTITGPAEVCVLMISNYSVSSSTGSTFNWEVFGGEIIGSSSSPQINVRWFDRAIGRVTVQEDRPSFCAGSDIMEIDLRPAPIANIQGSSTVCNQSQGLIYSTDAQPNVTFQWSVEGGTIVGASNASSIAVNWTKSGTGKVHLIQRSSLCESSDSLYVTFYPAIAAPSITSDGNVLSAPDASDYQWFHNDEVIQGATDQQFTAGEPGMYKVQITDGKGCSALSFGYPYLITAIEADPSTSLQTYPNPVRDHFFIDLNSAYRGPVELMLVDITGRIVSNAVLLKDKQALSERISVENLQSGFFTLVTKTGNVKTQIKVIVE